MFRSMTAFGRSLVRGEICDLSLELMSLNRKGLDIRITLPNELSRFEPFLRSLINGVVERGTVQVKVQVLWKGELPIDIYPNLPLIKKYVDIRRQVGQSDESKWIDWAFEQEGSLITLENEESDPLIKSLLKEAFEKAYEPFLKMKMLEGDNLFQDVYRRSKFLENGLKEIEQLAPQATAKYREKIGKILLEHSPTPEDRERLLKEAALYADRVDITEEITRFRSHLTQLDHLAQSSDPFIGKTVDFLLQELMREINTIGNKAQDHTISSKVVLLKGELEKIREQIQNVE